MKNDILQLYPHINAICLALLLFMTVFVGTIISTYTKTSKQKFHHLSHLPLGDDQ